MPNRQLDLFESQELAARKRPYERGPKWLAYIDRLRRQLHDTLRMAQEAERLPWPDPLRAVVAEQSFRSIAETWLPEDEARQLSEALEVEMVRLFEAEDAANEAAGLIPPKGEEPDEEEGAGPAEPEGR